MFSLYTINFRRRSWYTPSESAANHNRQKGTAKRTRVLKTIPRTKSSAKYTILKNIANNMYDKVLRKTKTFKFRQTMSVQNSSVKNYPVEISAEVICQKVALNKHLGGILAKPTCQKVPRKTYPVKISAKGIHKKVTHKCNP